MESEKSAYEIETPHKGIPYVEFYETLQRMIKKCITDRYGNEFLPVCDETCKGLLTIPNTTGNAATSIEYNYDDYEVIKELIERINDYGAVLSLQRKELIEELEAELQKRDLNYIIHLNSLDSIKGCKGAGQLLMILNFIQIKIDIHKKNIQEYDIVDFVSLDNCAKRSDAYTRFGAIKVTPDGEEEIFILDLIRIRNMINLLEIESLENKNEEDFRYKLCFTDALKYCDSKLTKDVLDKYGFTDSIVKWHTNLLSKQKTGFTLNTRENISKWHLNSKRNLKRKIDDIETEKGGKRSRRGRKRRTTKRKRIKKTKSRQRSPRRSYSNITYCKRYRQRS